MNQNLDVGNVISRVFGIYGDQFVVLFLSALAVNIAAGVIIVLLTLVGSIVGLLVGFLILIVANFFYTGMVVRLVEDVQDGRLDASVGQLFESVAPVVLPLIGAGILAAIGIAFGFLLLIIPGIFLLTIWAVVAPCVVIERTGVTGAFGRSYALVKQSFWQTLGAILVMALIYFVIGLIIGAIGTALGDDVVGAIFRIFGNALTAPLIVLAAAVIYFELRRVEGGGAAAGGAAVAAGGVGGAVAPGAPAPPAAPAPEAPQPQQTPPPQQPPPPPPPGGPQSPA